MSGTALALSRSGMTLPLVLVGHFLSAFAALGAPVFFPTLLPMLQPHLPKWEAGILFALPTVMTALAAPFWGRFADRFGRRLSLRRAHLGLTVGFILAGMSRSVPFFAVALVIQGSCGGAMAASNSYLATQADRDHMRRVLAWTQFSARLAMVVAPGAVGLFLDDGFGLRLYLCLAVLPLIALISTCWLPADKLPVERRTADCIRISQCQPDTHDWRIILFLQAALSAALVITFPYFIPYANQIGLHTGRESGMIYALPQLVCLALLPSLHRFIGVPAGMAGYALFGVASTAQAVLELSPPGDPSTAIILVSLCRLVMGAGLAIGLLALNATLVNRISGTEAGLWFSRFDAAGKWAGSAAGAAAGLCVSASGASTPFIVSALLAFLAAPFFLILTKKQRRLT